MKRLGKTLENRIVNLGSKLNITISEILGTAYLYMSTIQKSCQPTAVHVQ
jgi:hypothetical protein